MPRRLLTALELPRVAVEMAALLPAHRWLTKRPVGEGQPVICLPGFSAGDSSTMILRRYLKRWGYDARPWGLGQNMNPADMRSFDDVRRARDALLEQLLERLRQIFDETGEQVSLLGWSLGGLMARWFASHHPELVRQIITLGTPFGDPRDVVVYRLMERFSHSPMSDEDFAEWIAMCEAPLPDDLPLSIVYSRSDGFVSPRIATHRATDSIENIHVPCSHVGFTLNPLSLYVIADRLAQPKDDWMPFAREGLKELLFQ